MSESTYPFLDTVTHAKKRAFLVAYCDTFDISASAKRVGISRHTHYFWLSDDPDYLSAFQKAKQVAAETLEAELTRRALEGVRRMKFYRGSPIMVVCDQNHPEAVEVGDDFYRPYYEHEYSDTLGIFLMKGAMPEKYRERYEVRDGDRDINETIERELAQLANRETSIASGGDSSTNGQRNGQTPSSST